MKAKRVKRYRRPAYFCDKTAAHIFKHLKEYKFNWQGRSWAVGKCIAEWMKETMLGKPQSRKRKESGHEA